MTAERGQINPVGLVVTTTIVTIMALLGIYIFSEVNQTVTISGSLAGTEEELLVGGAHALKLAVGVTSVVMAAILLLRNQGM